VLIDILEGSFINLLGVLNPIKVAIRINHLRYVKFEMLVTYPSEEITEPWETGVGSSRQESGWKSELRAQILKYF
jgi:hypothetical protein